MNKNQKMARENYIKERLFHISEEGNIKKFIPQPSPSAFKGFDKNVVFAITGTLLHNYLFPRNCPRICYYVTSATTEADKEKFWGKSTARFIVAIEEAWADRITQSTIYCYEFPANSFELLDECAGYYISYQTITPTAITAISNPFTELAMRKNVELRILPTLLGLADEVKQSSLAFSLIRMRHAAAGK